MEPHLGLRGATRGLDHCHQLRLGLYRAVRKGDGKVISPDATHPPRFILLVGIEPLAFELSHVLFGSTAGRLLQLLSKREAAESTDQYYKNDSSSDHHHLHDCVVLFYAS